MAEEHRSLKTKIRKSVPVRAFGRALNWVGSGARSAVKTPLKAAQRRRILSGGPTACAQVEAEPPPPANGDVTFQTLTDEYKQAVHHTQQKLSSQLQESADFLRQHLPFAQQSSSGFLAANCFPPRLVTRSSPGNLAGEDAQDLVSVGSREMLRFKLYDFAVYLDRKQARGSRLSKRFRGGRQQLAEDESELPLTHGIRDSNDIEMCLMVRAARNLPIRLLAKEYERILKRRLRVVGGSPNDAALRQMMQHFREDTLPESVKAGASVRKGTVLTFSRDSHGRIVAAANGEHLVSVASDKLAEAVFDIYLGDQVVSNKARRDAGASFVRMLGDADFAPPQDELVCSDKSCRVGRL